MYKKLITIFLFILLFQGVFAFSFTQNIGSLFKSFFGLEEDDKEIETSLISKNSFNFLDNKLSFAELKKTFEREDVKNYLLELENNCYYIEIENQDFATFTFDDSYSLNGMYENKDICSNYIKVSEDLLLEINENGVNKDNALEILLEMDINTGLYFDLVKLI